MIHIESIAADTREGTRTAERMLALREALDAQIPARTLDKTLLLATWNIREFDSAAYGERVPEAMLYIAEIVSRFDLVSIQEVRRDLRALEALVDLLGHHWRYTVTDVTAGQQGNRERIAFVYDTRKVNMGGVAGEVVLPPMRGPDGLVPVTQIARTPYLVGFELAWTRLLLCGVHIVYGSNIANDPARVWEIRELARLLRERSDDPTSWAPNFILLGDFNIFRTGDMTLQALTDAGFEIPAALREVPTNLAQNRLFDQIAVRIQDGSAQPTDNAGAFDFTQFVFRDEDEAEYVEQMGEAYLVNSRGETRDEASKRRYYRTFWRTHQLSDHLPLWVELELDHTDAVLGALMDKPAPEPAAEG